MSYIPDLQPYSYGFTAKPGVLAWGWLEKFIDIPQGPTDDFLLIALMAAPEVNRYRGSHKCQWCPQEPGTASNSGNGEIWFTGKSGTTYVAPALVVHYIREHGYGVPKVVAEEFSGVFISSDEEVESFRDTEASEAFLRPEQVRWEDTQPRACPLCRGAKILHIPSAAIPGLSRVHGCTYCGGTGLDV
jgi:hypothetical protein